MKQKKKNVNIYLVLLKNKRKKKKKPFSTTLYIVYLIRHTRRYSKYNLLYILISREHS